jgi:hypothetical protein
LICAKTRAWNAMTLPCCCRATQISKQWKNIDHYATNALTLGRQLSWRGALRTRRRVVTVTTSFV